MNTAPPTTLASSTAPQVALSHQPIPAPSHQYTTLSEMQGLHNMQLDALKRFKKVFTGDKGQSILAFLDQFDHWCKNQGHQDEYKCKNFGLLLDGEAHDAYRNLSDATKNNYTKLRKQMITIFAPARMPPGENFQKLFK